MAFLGVGSTLLPVCFIKSFPETGSPDMSSPLPTQGEGCRLGGFSGTPSGPGAVLAQVKVMSRSLSSIEFVMAFRSLTFDCPSKALQSHPVSHGRWRAGRVMQGRLQSTAAPRSLCRRELEPG
ncbi:hypothetical protein B0T18DRAFT_422257 [Schizothecium vesticola]|uniref:Uncharacterized protein n=1 Tax=Schizothecium vesticola TaxID=314040 RepID=A0AA40BQU8_9PEZI|nr:hypothetical protein B0T18DRAFT_422257 [Schizothecium vesticola]